MLIYIELLTVFNFVECFLPLIFRLSGGEIAGVYVADSSPTALLFIHLACLLRGIPCEKLSFEASDVRDDRGVSAFHQVLYEDIGLVRKLIREGAGEFFNGLPSGDRLNFFLSKSQVCSYEVNGFSKHDQLWHVLILLRVVCWHQRKVGQPRLPVLYIRRRAFQKYAMAHAAALGIELRDTGAVSPRESCWHGLVARLKKVSPGLLLNVLRYWIVKTFRSGGRGVSGAAETSKVRMGVVYNYHLHVDKPGTISDLSFMHENGIRSGDACMLFNGSADPLDATKWRVLKQAGVGAIALTPQASLLPEGELSIHAEESGLVIPSRGGVPSEWQGSVQSYDRMCHYWQYFFKAHGIRLWSTWNDCELRQIAMADALHALGGVFAVYQRSYKGNSSVQLGVAADLVFAFAPALHDIMLGHPSDFRYSICTGYMPDRGFALLKPVAEEVRGRLMRAGARRIIAYFDETTIEDGRWFSGHEFTQRNYAFWIEKMLKDTQLGLVFKPKRPGDIRRRLGPVASLLAEAERTGRCYVFDSGALVGVYLRQPQLFQRISRYMIVFLPGLPVWNRLWPVGGQ